MLKIAVCDDVVEICSELENIILDFEHVTVTRINNILCLEMLNNVE